MRVSSRRAVLRVRAKFRKINKKNMNLNIVLQLLLKMLVLEMKQTFSMNRIATSLQFSSDIFSVQHLQTRTKVVV